MKILFLLYLLTVTIGSSLSYSNELTPQDTKRLELGEVIVKKTPLKGKPWPIVEVYQMLKATPKEALAIFLAYDHQKNYVPGILKSKPIKEISPTEIHTEYELKTPWPLDNSHYVQGAKWIQMGKDSYRADWYNVTSDSTHEDNGYAIFEFRGAKTLFKYHVYIYPKSLLAGVLKDLMPKDVEKSVRQIGLYIERLKQENSPILSKYLKVLEEQAQGHSTYLK